MNRVWLLIWLAGCGLPTETVVELRTDQPLERLDRYRVDVSAPDGDGELVELSRMQSDPPSFGIAPAGERTRTITLRIEAFAGDQSVLATSRYLDGFEQGRSRVILCVTSNGANDEALIPPGDYSELPCAGSTSDAGEDPGEDASVDAATDAGAREDAEIVDLGTEPEPTAAISMGGYQPDFAGPITFDRGGDLIVAGTFFDTLVLTATITLTAVGSRDLFVAKFTPDGRIVWWRQLQGLNGSFAGAVFDPITDRIYLTGSFAQSLELDGITLILGSSSGSWGFVLVMNQDGQPLGGVAIPSTGFLLPRDIALDPDTDRVFISGTFLGGFALDVCSLDDGPTDSDGFVLALDAALPNDMTCVWARGFASAGTDTINAVSFAPPDRLYVGGSYATELSFPDANLDPLPDLALDLVSALAAELSAASGELVTAIGLTPATSINGIAANGARVLAGGDLRYGPIFAVRSSVAGIQPISTGTPEHRTMLFDFNPELEVFSVEVPYSESGTVTLNDVRVDSRGGWIAGGNFRVRYDRFFAIGFSDPVWLALSPERTIVWREAFASTLTDSVGALAVDRINRQYAVIGGFHDTIQLADETLTSSGSGDLFLLIGGW